MDEGKVRANLTILVGSLEKTKGQIKRYRTEHNEILEKLEKRDEEYSQLVESAEAWLFGKPAKGTVPENVAAAPLAGSETVVAPLPKMIAVPPPLNSQNKPPIPPPKLSEPSSFDRPLSPRLHHSDSNQSNDSELNSSVDSVDLRRSFQDVFNEHRSPNPNIVLQKDNSFESVDVDNDENNEEEDNYEEGGEDQEDKVEKAPDSRNVVPAPPFPPPKAASPIFRRRSSSIASAAANVQFSSLPPAENTEKTQPKKEAVLQRHHSDPSFDTSDETLKHLLLERRRSNSLAQENESLRIVLENLKKGAGNSDEDGDEGSSGDDVKGPAQTLIMANLRQSNSVLQEKVKELAMINSSFQDRLAEKDKGMEELSKHHIITTDQLAMLSVRIDELKGDVKEYQVRENALENLVTGLQVKLSSTKAQLEEARDGRRDAGEKFMAKKEGMQEEIEGLKVQLGEVTKAKKMDTAKVRRRR